jgi:uncharacterized coiled-coil protein SlyX
MSRADELLNCERQDYCGDVSLLERAEGIIHELETILAERDNQIAELTVLVADHRKQVSEARAAASALCNGLISVLRGAAREGDLERTAGRIISEFEDQLRACGIEVP